MRCASPPLSVGAARSSVREPRPTSSRNSRRLPISGNRSRAMPVSRWLMPPPLRSPSIHRRTSVTVRAAMSVMPRPANFTARAPGFRRVPWQEGQALPAPSARSASSGSAKLCSRPFSLSCASEPSSRRRWSWVSRRPVPPPSGDPACLLLFEKKGGAGLGIGRGGDGAGAPGGKRLHLPYAGRGAACAQRRAQGIDVAEHMQHAFAMREGFGQRLGQQGLVGGRYVHACHPPFHTFLPLTLHSP